MDSNTQTNLAQVVAQIVQQASLLSAIVAPVTYGVLEALKKTKFPNKYAGLLSAPIGVLVVFLIQGFNFTGIGIMVGILAGLATSGVYSAVKSATPAKLLASPE